MSTAAIILAAGESRRMGSPKAMLPFRGGTFLSELAATLSAHCGLVIAVFGHDAATLISSTPAGIIPVANPDYQLGMLTSLQAGLRALPSACEAVVFTLVDHPAVSSETVRAVTLSSAQIAIPRYDGRRGHPVLIRKSIALEFLAEPASSKVRDVIDRHSSEIVYLDVDDSGVIDDIDDPALYQALLAREAARV